MIVVENEFAYQDDSLIKYLICMVCRQVYKNPIRLHKCGHTFCQNCIHSTTCFSCNAIIVCKQQDLMANGLVSDLKVKCLTEDCPFKGSYEEFESSHRRNCKLKECGGLENWKRKIQESLSEMINIKLSSSQKKDGVPKKVQGSVERKGGESIPHVSELEVQEQVMEAVSQEESRNEAVISQQFDDEFINPLVHYKNDLDQLD